MNLRNAVAVGLLLVAVCGTPSVPHFSGTPAQTTEPSDSMKATIRPVLKVVQTMNAIDRLWLNHIYTNAADVVKIDGVIDPPVMTTTEGLRAVHVSILKFIWRGMADNQPGKYPGLKEAIDSVVTEAIGDTRKPLTPELRQKACEVFEAIAWAGLGRG